MEIAGSSRVTTKGQVTIPASLREAMQLRTGQSVNFRQEDGKIVIEPVLDDVRAAFGLVKASPAPVDADSLPAAEAAAVQRYLATRSSD